MSLLKKQQNDIDELKLEQLHELSMADKEMDRAKIEGGIKIEHAEVGAFSDSQRTLGNLQGALRWVRPAITGYLLIVSSILVFVVWDLLFFFCINNNSSRPIANHNAIHPIIIFL